MKKYWLFVGEDYYPSGGMLDFKISSDSLDEIKILIKNLESCMWAHIYDRDENKIILETADISRTFSECEYIWRAPN